MIKKLLKDKKVERVVFNEITKKAVKNGIDNPREINTELVDAYMARRALDYLVGFNISPILWTKLPGSKSAGRVQSVALKLIVERENEIELFKPQEYWSIQSLFKNKDTKDLNSKIILFKSEKVDKFYFKNEEQTKSAVDEIKKHDYQITQIEKKTIQKESLRSFYYFNNATRGL
jgi:DNA topoisomerase-1